jgi:choline-sulfatase
MLTVSFTHPHDPYVARPRFWDRYAGCAHLEPRVPDPGYDRQDPHTRRLLDASDWRSYAIGPEDVRRARRGYFANISYLDERIGEILAVLAAIGQADRTIVLFTSDHGDMLGERGLWFKMSFFEDSARVPLMIAAPELGPGRITTPVSTLDLLPTLCELVGIDLGEVAPWTDGESLSAVMAGAERRGPVRMEYAAEGSLGPMVALRRGRWKLTLAESDPPMLFDLEADPDERSNLAADPAHAATLAGLTAEACGFWDLAAYDAAVRESQARRHLVYEALRTGAYHPWDHQPLQRASERYMRNHMDLNELEERQRYPRGGQTVPKP